MHRRPRLCETDSLKDITWVIVTWSLKNCRSARRTSKLALALSRFLRRRPVACNKMLHKKLCSCPWLKSNNSNYKKRHTSSQEYSNMTFAPSHKHTESVSSMLAREYIPSDTSKSVISACNPNTEPRKNYQIKNTCIDWTNILMKYKKY